MGLVVVVVLAALLLRPVLRLRRPGAPVGVPRLRSCGLLLAALLAQAAGALVGGTHRPLAAAGLMASTLLVLVFLHRNRSLPGRALLTVGLLANALVVGLNGAMPVSLTAAARAGAAVGDTVLGNDPRHEVASEDSRLRLLGDVVPVPLPLRPEVVSPGDVIVAAGLAQLVLLAPAGGGRRTRAGTRARAGNRAPRPASRPHLPPRSGHPS